ncbi:MAG: general secretion pathway protein GspB [Luteimonas sp.]|nr:general secretion pathway protein GspB [Luteimonas sp.]
MWLVIGVAAVAIVLWLVQSVRQPPAPAAVESIASDTAGGDIAPTVVADADPPRPTPPTTNTPMRPVEPTRNTVPDIVLAKPPDVPPPPPAPAAAPDIPTVTPPLAAAPETLAEPPPPVAVASDAHLLRLADLSAEQRKQLPPLKISMHMWNDAPAQRFVIIDGNRLAEGDRIGDAVVEAIRTDSVVLDWNGRRLKLPIR